MSRALSDSPQFPGFDGLRLLAALTVIFSHAFLIATGSEETEPFVRLLGPGNILGLYGVYTFFIISGFLLARSLSYGDDIVQFIVNRLLRIYPAFCFCILLTAFVVGPLVSSSSPMAYFSSPDLYSSVAVTITCMCDSEALPGVYAYQGKVASVVNGSLWSLSYEVLSYVFLVWLWIAFRSTAGVAITLAVVATATAMGPGLHKYLPGIAYTLPYFAGGVVMHSFHERFGAHKIGAFLCVAGLVIAGCFGLHKIAFAVFGAYLIVFLAGRPNIGSRFASRFGDMSYGVYLFGWPMEQVAKQFSGTGNPALLMILALPPIFLAALISCHAIERPALSLKKRIANAIRTALQRSPGGGHRSRAFVLGATLSTVVAVPALLLSEIAWWYVTERVVELIALAVLCGVVAAAFARVRETFRP